MPKVIKRSWWLRFLSLLKWLVIAFLVLQMWYFAQVIAWVNSKPTPTQFMRDALAELRTENPRASLRHDWVDYAQMTTQIKRAVIASEDSGFTEHDGVEWAAIESALKRNLKRGRISHGGSTISQQLAKNLFLTGSRSYLRKGQELLITLMLEVTWSKKRILEVYLNVAQWGKDIFGIEAAAQYYYGVSASQLSDFQAAKLAAMLPKPSYYQRHQSSSYLAGRARTIQARMRLVDIP